MVSRQPTITQQACLITKYLGVDRQSSYEHWRVVEDQPLRVHTHTVNFEGYPEQFGETRAVIKDGDVTVYDSNWSRLAPGAWTQMFSRLYNKALTKAADDAFEEYLQSRELKPV